MIEIINDREKIGACYELFRERVNSLGGQRLTVRVGFRMMNKLENIVWVSDCDFWYRLAGTGWNAFGAGKPSISDSNSITCEINFSEEGIDRRMGGAFGEDRNGRLYVFHRGKIGGGRKNIGKAGFMRSFTGKAVEVIDGDIRSAAIPVASLKSKNFASELSLFIHEVERFKENAVVNKRYADVVVPKGFYVPLYSGRWNRESLDHAEESFEHGLVTNTIANILVSRGIRVDTDWRNDIAAYNRRGSVKSVYEIETTLRGEAVYSAVGKLLSTSKRAKGRLRKVLALPASSVGTSSLSKSVESDIKALGIRVLLYRITGGRVEFSQEGNTLS